MSGEEGRGSSPKVGGDIVADYGVGLSGHLMSSRGSRVAEKVYREVHLPSLRQRLSIYISSYAYVYVAPRNL